MLARRDLEGLNLLFGKVADQRPRAAPLTGFDRGIDEKDCPSGGVEQVIRPAAHIVAAKQFVTRYFAILLQYNFIVGVDQRPLPKGSRSVSRSYSAHQLEGR